MAPSRRATRTPAPRESLARRSPAIGDVVEVFWDGDDTYYRGTLARRGRNHPFKFFLRYDDGDKEYINLDEEHWRYAHTVGNRKPPFEPGELAALYGDAPSATPALADAAELVSQSCPGPDAEVAQGEGRNGRECDTATQASIVTPLGSRASSATTEWNEPADMLPIKVRFKRGMMSATPSHFEKGSSLITSLQARELSPASERSGVLENEDKASASSKPVADRTAKPPFRRVTRATAGTENAPTGIHASMEWNGTQGEFSEIHRTAGMSSDRCTSNKTEASVQVELAQVLRSGRLVRKLAHSSVEHPKVTPSLCPVAGMGVKSSTVALKKKKASRVKQCTDVSGTEDQRQLKRRLRSSKQAAERDVKACRTQVVYPR